MEARENKDASRRQQSVRGRCLVSHHSVTDNELGTTHSRNGQLRQKVGLWNASMLLRDRSLETGSVEEGCRR
jgi:hypothetical protein